MTNYEIILYWSVDDDVFVAEFLNCPVVRADGPTRQEALTNAETVIQEWIETASELGRPIPERAVGFCSPDVLNGASLNAASLNAASMMRVAHIHYPLPP